MNFPQFALTHRSIVLAFFSVFIFVGLFNFSDMSRREDPEIIIRDTLVITSWPGASADKVEELITDPLEKIIAQITEVDVIESKSMVGLSVIQIAIDDRVNDTDQVWDEIRAKVNSIEDSLPLGSQRPFVNSDFGDVYEIVLALHQTPIDGKQRIEHPYTPRQLEIFAERIEDELELIDSIAKVEFWGVQAERIYVEVDSADWAKINFTANQLKEVFEDRNIIQPGGELDTEIARYAINPTGEFTSVEQLNDLVISRVDGNLPVRLGDLPIKIDRRYEEPIKSLTRFTTPELPHNASLVLGVSMKSGNNVTEMSKEVDKALKQLYLSYLPPDIKLVRVNDLPRQVDTRINDFQVNLLQGMAIVLGLALIVMGWRPALIMAGAIPVSMICAFAVVRFLGIELEQFSIASLIIALGMVVDNAIVVSENSVRLINDGMTKKEAVIKGTQDLLIPILTSTLTTIFAFLPMLTMVGNVGEYVGSLPIVVPATLLASFFVAMLVTPIMCVWLLNEKSSNNDENLKEQQNKTPLYDRILSWCLDNKVLVLGISFLLFISSLGIIPVIGNQFFPSGARDQFFIKVWLPEGSPIEATSDVARQVERILVETSPVIESGQTQQRLANSITFVGSGGTRLMLTQEPEYDYPYYAFLLVNMTDDKYTEEYAREIRKKVVDIYQARVTVDLFMLGPPIRDPIAFRLSGPDPKIIRSKAQEMIDIFKSTRGAIEPYSNWGVPANEIELRIDPYAANLAGVSNADIALTTSSMLSGAQLTSYREADHLVPVMLRTIREKRRDLNDLSGIFVNGADGKVPLASVAEVILKLKPAVIARQDNIPTVTVGARVEEGLLANSVADEIRKKLHTMMQSLPPGYFIEQGGEHEETVKARKQVIMAVGMAMVLIVLVLITQYNSLLKPLVILFTIPLAMIGVLVGLLITGWAMGFMAMLGVLSLIGIVINNAIILIDFIETRVSAGQELRKAVIESGRLRMRPIVLTSLTTIGGLLPLSLFGGALWAPMTNGMIFGLLFSTVFTLIIVPTLYVVFVDIFKMKIT